jgi:hypothetical protein
VTSLTSLVFDLSLCAIRSSFFGQSEIVAAS